MSDVTSSVVVLSDISKFFGRFAALRAITAEFEAARIYVILGDNGAGKSTLLRTITGLLPPTRGSVRVLGARRVSEIRSHIGFMAHAPLLYDELTGMENLRYFAALYGIGDGSVCARAIGAVGLDPELTRRVGQYSQGMRQRLSLARAVIHDPALLLLDEPFSNVDAASATHMVGLLAAMRERGKTIFVVTHQPALLTGVADESVLMSAGRITERIAGVPRAAS